MARRKKHSVCWTICYALKMREDSDDIYTGTWFAYGRSAEEAKKNFLREKAMEAEFCGGDPAEDYTIVNVAEGFSA